jgi:hypothetical protein
LNIGFYNGREGATELEQLESLLEAIFENWNPEKFDENLLVLVDAGVEHEFFYKY